jgi:hypothetical protein
MIEIMVFIKHKKTIMEKFMQPIALFYLHFYDLLEADQRLNLNKIIFLKSDSSTS